jgi:hypothetical protein
MLHTRRYTMTLMFSFFLTGCGGGGGGGGGATVAAPEPIIRLNQSDLNYRTPNSGDLIAYEYTAEERQIFNQEITSTYGDSGTVDIEYFTTTLQSPLAEAWSDFEIMLEQVSYSNGNIDSNIFAYTSRVLNVADQESFFISVIDGQSYYGSTYHPPLKSGTSFTENYEVHYENNSRKFGQTTFTVSTTEIIDTAIGRVEVFKYTAQEKWELKELLTFAGPWGIREKAELSTTAWIHPKIGVLKVTSLIKYDDNTASTLSYSEQDITLEIRSTNIQLPN